MSDADRERSSERMPRTDRVTLKSPVTLTFDKLTSSTIGQLFTDIGSLLDVERSNILSLQVDIRAIQPRRRDVLGAHMGKFMLRREGRHTIVAYSGDGENETHCVITHASEFKEFWRTALPNLGAPGSFEYSVQHITLKADRVRTNPLSEHILRIETHNQEIIDARAPLSAPSMAQPDVPAPEVLGPDDQPTLSADAEFPIADEPTLQEEGLPEGSRYFDSLQAVRNGILQTFDDLHIEIDGTVNLYLVCGEEFSEDPLILERKGGKPNRAMLHTDQITSELLHDVPPRVNIDDVRYRNIFNKLVEELARRMNIKDLQFLVTTETL